MPSGIEQVTRFLEPLGYRLAATYPLTRLHMTGRSYTHRDLPEHVSQWFVSELHPDSFSPTFQAAVERVLGTARDPIEAATSARLEWLAAEATIPFDEAVELVTVLLGCLRRLHDAPTIADYRILAAESPEMAWIATEGTTFNHATDRVADVETTAAAERHAGRPVKDTVEVSASGRVRQTAHVAHVATRVLERRRRRRRAAGGADLVLRVHLPGARARDRRARPGVRCRQRPGHLRDDGPGRHHLIAVACGG